MKGKPLDLREVSNAACPATGSCDEVPSVMDKLPVRCVGDWSYEKIYRLVRYFGIFTRGMRNKWIGLNYVEICSGPGRCVIREKNVEMDGTALAIINHPIFKLLEKAVFIDNDVSAVDALNKRIVSLDASSKATAVVGDYADPSGIVRILDKLKGGCLNLCFIDPTHCDIPFDTITAIAKKLTKVDFIINVALGTDVARNIVNAILDPAFANVREKYEVFLGSPGFLDQDRIRTLASSNKHDELRRAFVNEYLARLAGIGLRYADAKPVRHYYRLLFVSSDPKGLEFWKKACLIGPDDQRELPIN